MKRANDDTSDAVVKKIIRIDSDLTLNAELLSDTFVSAFHKNWHTNAVMNIEKPTVYLHQHPFKICVIQEFLSNANLLKSIVDEMQMIEWQRKQMDLYEFYQSADLCGTTLPYLNQFYNLLKLHILPWMERLSGIRLTHVSASCSMYNSGDHLLVHDDLLSDRRIAYVLYLSPWPGKQSWTEQMGGALELFSCDEHGQPKYPIVKAISPQNNQFVFFKVCDTSFHQVGEVTNFDYPRLTINGWFHGPIPQSESAETTKLSKYLFKPESVASNPNDEAIELSEWIHENYLKPNIKRSIQQHVELKSEASLGSFFIPEFYDILTTQLTSGDEEIQWKLQGPANQKMYESLCMDTVRGPVQDLLKLFHSPAMFQLLHEYTELDLAGKAARKPNCIIEIHRITQNSYSLLGDPTAYGDSSLDVILFFNTKNNDIGVISYLNPEECAEVDDDIDSDDEEEEDASEKDAALLSVVPKDNALNLVYRSTGTAKFLKYISKSCIPANEYVYMMTASYRE